MTTIEVTNQRGELVYLELYKNDPINLKYQYSDIEDITKATSAFTQTFKIPATLSNQSVFGEIHNANVFADSPAVTNPTINPKVRMPAVISVNTIPIVRGYIQLKEVTLLNDNYEYTVAFFGESGELAKAIGDRKLADLDWSGYDHALNSTNVLNSWSGTLFAGDVRYGMIDKGLRAYSLVQTSDPLRGGEFTPFLSVFSILQTIFNAADHELDTSFFTEDIYTPWWNGGIAIQDQDQVSKNTFVALRNTTDLSTPSQGTVVTQVSPQVGAGNTYDETGDIISNGHFQPTYSGYFKFKVAANVGQDNATDAFSSLPEAKIVIFTGLASNPNIIWQQAQYTELPAYDNVGAIVTNVQLTDTTPYIWLEAGQVYRLGVQKYSPYQFSPGSFLYISVAGGTMESGSGWELLPDNVPTDGITVDMGLNAPDIKILDYLNGLKQMFNLVFIPDKTIPNKIKVEPWSDYMAAGSTIDWTHLIDNTAITIKPTTDIQKKKYEWKYSAGNDILNKAYQENQNRTFGRFRIEDVGNDFATGEQNIECIFKAYPVNQVQQRVWLIHKGVDAEGNVLKETKVQVAYWGGLMDYSYGTNVAFTSAKFYDDATSTVINTQVPFFGNYSTPVPNIGDSDLNYMGDVPLHQIIANPVNNLYNQYWRRFISQFYSEYSRIMDCKVKLDSVDIATFNFNDRIFIRDSYWRVLEINYIPNAPDLARVKLIKDFYDTPSCTYTPVLAGINSVITWEDAAGNPVSPTQECCEEYGYVWLIDRAECVSQIIDTNPYNPIEDPVTPPNSPGGGISGGSGTHSTGIAIGFGDDVYTGGSTSGIIGGHKIEVESGASNVIAIGNNIKVAKSNGGTTLADKELRSVYAYGDNTYAFENGVHRGLGSFHDSVTPHTKLGQNQTGEIAWVFEGGFDQGTTIELLLGGVERNRLQIPDNSCLMLNFDVLLNYFVTVGSTHTPTAMYARTFVATVQNVGGVTTVQPLGALSPVALVGGAAGDIKMVLNNLGNGMFNVQLTSDISNTDTCRIVCKGSYTMMII